MATFITRLSIGAGLTVAIKDLIDLAGLPTTAGCRAVADHAEPAVADAACVREITRLAAAGQVRIVGKTNLHELAYGTTGKNPWFGTPRNPLDAGLVPGGSSSGSAVAVADGDADVALGTDTGGSVHIPAACCGVTGLKTTWGRVPLDGVWPLAPSLDTVGPMARDVAGLVRGMRLLEPGFAPTAADVTAVHVHRLRLDADPVVDAAVDAALARSGLSVSECPDPGWTAAWTAADVLLGAEAWRSDRALLDRRAGVSDDIAARIEAGARVTAAQEDQARAAQRAWQQTLAGLATSTSILALPTLVQLPPPLEVERFPGNRLTLPVNLAGLPAVSIPVPSDAGPPAGLQLVGPAYGEELLLAVSALVEAATANS